MKESKQTKRRKARTFRSRITFVGELRRVNVRPGDVFVLKSEHRITDEMVDHLIKMWKDTMGEDVKLLVLGDGLKLGVIRGPQTSEGEPSSHSSLLQDSPRRKLHGQAT